MTLGQLDGRRCKLETEKGHWLYLQGSFVRSAPVDNSLYKAVHLGESLGQLPELLALDKAEGDLRMGDDELQGVLSKRVIQRHAVD